MICAPDSWGKISMHKEEFLPKLLEIEKEIVCEMARGDKQYLKQSADRKAQIRKAFVTLIEMICALRTADCFRYCLSPRATRVTHVLFVYFQ